MIGSVMNLEQPGKVFAAVANFNTVPLFGGTEINTVDFRIIPPIQNSKWIKKKGKGIPVPDQGGLQGCETSRSPQFVENRLIDGGKVISPTRRPPFIPRKIPGTHFC
jgi:hypothetical protein